MDFKPAVAEKENPIDEILIQDSSEADIIDEENNESNEKEVESEISLLNEEFSWEKCYPLFERNVDITTKDEYSKFAFKPSYMSKKHFWDENLENRYKAEVNETKKFPLKVSLVVFRVR